MSTALAKTTATTDPAITDPAVALAALAHGVPVIVVDDLTGTGAEIAMLAATATPATMARLVRESSGFVCVTVSPGRAHRLGLPPMTWADGDDTRGGRQCVAVDAVSGTTTGISAADRTLTLRALADPVAEPGWFTRPGHVVPVVADTAIADHAGLLARAARRAAGPGPRNPVGDPPPVAYASLVSRRDPLRIADAAEATAWGLPVLYHSTLIQF